MRDAERNGISIGLVSQGWFPDVGGIESHTRDLARELRARGHRVSALCLDYRQGREPYSVTRADVDGVRVTRMAYLYHDHRALADLVKNSSAEQVLLRWLGETRPDLVHVHHATGFGLGALERVRAAGTPLVMTLHDYWSLCPRGQMLQPDGTISEAPDGARCGDCLRATWPHLMPTGQGERRGADGSDVTTDRAAAEARTAFALGALRAPDRLLTPSEAARRVYVRAGIAPERIEVCENGIDVGRLAGEVRRLRGRAAGRAAGEVRLGVLGSVLPSKGALELARAFRRVRAPGLSLEIHGNLPSYHGDTSYVDALRALAAEDPRVTIHGPYELPSLPRILASLDGVAAPSRWVEVYGLTVREARACGLPVLVSDVGDLAACADGGRAGLVVPWADEDAWVAALERFGTDAEARRDWAACALVPRGSADMTDQLERAYREVLASRPRRAERRGFFARLFGRGT